MTAETHAATAQLAAAISAGSEAGEDWAASLGTQATIDAGATAGELMAIAKLQDSRAGPR